jgi:hypothetical protein
METFEIQYLITLPDAIKKNFRLKFDAATMELLENEPTSPPFWTKLDFKQCSHCPLNAKKEPYCPLSLNLVNFIKHFNEIKSYEEVMLEIITSRRTIAKKIPIQDALSAMMGLIIPTSGCPHTAYFRPMARFHLPLADASETIYRSASMYMLAQYFLHRRGNSVDLEFKGLTTIYRNMQILNSAIAKRLRAATKTDSSVNALILLDIFTLILPTAIKDSLEKIQHLFQPYWSDPVQ